MVFIPSNSTEKQWAEPSHNGGHALVMALKNSTSSQVLYDNTVSAGYPAYTGKYKTSGTTSVPYSDWGNDKSGYTNTNTYLTTTGSPAGYNALHHTPAAPSTSSGWFLPTVGQWIYVLAPRAGLTPTSCSLSSWTDTGNKAITALNSYLSSSGATYSSLNNDGNYYWPNTNWLLNGTVGVWNIRFSNNSIGFNGESNKADGDHLGYVRPFLAF